MTRMARQVLIYAYFLLLALALTHPLLFQFDRVLIGTRDSDVTEYARHIWWMTVAVREGMSPFYHPTLAYPDGLLAYWLWAIPLQSFPAWLLALVLPLNVAYNLMTLFRLALNGWAVAFLVHRLLDGTHTPTPQTATPLAPALLAGSIFMLYPTLQAHLIASHVGLLALWPAPLYVDALLRLRRGASWRLWLWTATTFVLAILGSTLLLLFVVAPLTGFVLLWAWGTRDWAWGRRIIIGAGLGGGVALVFAAPALYEQLFLPSAVALPGVVDFSADVLATVSPHFTNPFWAWLGYPQRVLSTNVTEGSAYIGLFTASLVIIGLWREPNARRWALLAATTTALAWGVVLQFNGQIVSLIIDGYPVAIPAPFALLANLPVFDIVRTPGRFNLTTGLAVAVAAAYGWMVVWQKIARLQAWRWGVLVLVIGVIYLDYQVGWANNRPNFPLTNAQLPAELTVIADDEHVRAVFNIPHDNLTVAKRAMYYQTAHTKPLIAGFISRQTPVSFAKRAVLQSTLAPALLQAAGADVVLLFHRWDDDLNQATRAALGDPFYEDAEIAAFRVPAAGTPPTYQVANHPISYLETETDFYVYSPGRAWVRLTSQVTADADRTLALQREGDTLHTITVRDEATLEAYLPLTPGYQTLTLALQPPCTRWRLRPPALCRGVFALGTRLSDAPLPDALAEAASLGAGVTLQGALVDDDLLALWWDAPASSSALPMRFVYGTDAAGNRVFEDEQILSAGVEQLRLNLATANIEIYLAGHPGNTLRLDGIAND